MIKLPAKQRMGRAKRGARSPHCLARSRGPGVQLGDTQPLTGHTQLVGELYCLVSPGSIVAPLFTVKSYQRPGI